jgi:hypothetical protein
LPRRPFAGVEVAVGAGLIGGAATGEADANLRGNSGLLRPYLLFGTATRFAAARVVESRVTVGLTRRFAVEGRASFSQPELRTSITGDAEGGPSLTVAERVDQYQIDGTLIVTLEELRIGRVLPFASAGAGYLRQLHAGHTLIEEGRVFHVGAGLRYALFARDAGVIKAAGVRTDVRLYLLTGAIQFDESLRPHGAVSGSLFVGF